MHGSDVENDALKGKQVFEEKLEAVPEAESVQSVRPFGDSFERAAATDGPDAASARASAPKLPLASAGQLTVYAKCFRSTDDDTVFARVYIETSADGAVFEGGTDQLEGSGGFLDVATPESDRELLATSTAADASVLDIGRWYAMAPDGTGARRHGRGRREERHRRRRRGLRRRQRLPVRRRGGRLSGS